MRQSISAQWRGFGITLSDCDLEWFPGAAKGLCCSRYDLVNDWN